MDMGVRQKGYFYIHGVRWCICRKLMTWQKITRHISDNRIEVESKSGNTYPVETDYDYLAEGVYSMLHNIADTESDRVIWAWVSFDESPAKFDDTVIKGKDEGPPEKPPWEHP